MNQMKKYCMGVVVYNPTLTELNNIENYAASDLFGLIMIFDNSIERINYRFKHKICQYRFQNENSGLAKPYNIMLQEAETAGYDYLCIMDQDSSFKIAEIKKLIDAIDCYEKPENVGAFCPVILKSGTECYQRVPTWNRKGWSINSGSILNIRCLKKHSIVYDEKIFLDGLDYDFGWTVSRNGCSIMQYQNSVLIQTFGYKTRECQSFMYHSAYRYYLIAHNRKYIFRKHFGLFWGLIYAQLKNLILSFRILFNEEEKLKKMISCYKGMLK